MDSASARPSLPRTQALLDEATRTISELSARLSTAPERSNENASAPPQARPSFQPPPKGTNWLVPVLVGAVVVLIVIVSVISEARKPRGYESRHEPVQAGVVQQPTVDTAEQDARRRMTKLVDDVAALIHAQSEVVRTERRGNETIRHYSFDKSRYDVVKLKRIQSEALSVLDQRHADSDGYIAASVFNIVILTTATEIHQAMLAGSPITEPATQTLQIGRDPRIARWLSASRFAEPHQLLEEALEQLLLTYEAVNLKHLSYELKRLDGVLTKGKAELERLESLNRIDEYNALVEEFNANVGRFRTGMATYESAAGLFDMVDARYDATLDQAILASKFDTIDLTASGPSTD